MDAVRSNWRKVALILAGWTLVAFIFATQSYLNLVYLGRPRPYAQVISIWLTCAAVWAMMTPLALWLARRFPVAKEHFFRLIALHLFVGSLIAALRVPNLILQPLVENANEAAD
jgi:hypothetical protein